MKKLFVSNNSVELGSLKSLLEEASIEYTVQNETTHENFPGAAFYPELWIVHDKDFARAAQIRDSWKSEPRDQGPWQCATCGEKLEGQFLSCWNCGGERGEQTSVSSGLQAEDQNRETCPENATTGVKTGKKRCSRAGIVAWAVVGTASLVMAGISLLHILAGDYGLETRNSSRDRSSRRAVSKHVAFFIVGAGNGALCLYMSWYQGQQRQKRKR